MRIPGLPSLFAIRRLRKPPKRVWLTLDDGPDAVHTGEILRSLDRHRIKATFFVIGEKVADRPAMVQRAFDAGHWIGNHTFSHPRLTELSPAEIREEIESTDRLISAFVHCDKLFRPPFGAIDGRIAAVAQELGHRTVLWNVDPNDWDPGCQPRGWIDKALHQVREKEECVILIHDDRRTTAANFDLLIGRLKKSGRILFEEPATLCEVAGRLEPA